MSDVTQTLSALVLVQKYRGDLVNTINRTSVLLKLLPVIPGNGKNCAWALKYSGQLSENYSEGADASNFGSNSQVAATLNWGMYRANSHISGTARRAAALSESPEGQQDLMGQNIIDAAEELTSKINIALFGGAGTGTTIAGLDVAIGDDANTYAGIDRSQAGNATFRPYVVDPGSLTALSFAQIRTDLSTIQTNSGRRPSVAICDLDVYNTVLGLFDPTKIFYVDTIQTPRGGVMLDNTQRGVIVENCIFIPDKDATANTISYLHLPDARIEFLPPAPQTMFDRLMGMGVMVPANDGFGQAPLGYELQPLAKNGDSDRFSLVSNLQLVIRRPNAFGQRQNVATA